VGSHGHVSFAGSSQEYVGLCLNDRLSRSLNQSSSCNVITVAFTAVIIVVQPFCPPPPRKFTWTLADVIMSVFLSVCPRCKRKMA